MREEESIELRFDSDCLLRMRWKIKKGEDTRRGNGSKAEDDDDGDGPSREGRKEISEVVM